MNSAWPQFFGVTFAIPVSRLRKVICTLPQTLPDRQIIWALLFKPTSSSRNFRKEMAGTPRGERGSARRTGKKANSSTKKTPLTIPTIWFAIKWAIVILAAVGGSISPGGGKGRGSWRKGG